MNRDYETVRQVMRNLPHLYLLDPKGGEIIIYTDSSSHAIGSVIGQRKLVNGKNTVIPLFYYSRLLKNNEKNYSIPQAELLAVTEISESFTIYYGVAISQSFPTVQIHYLF